MSHETTKPGAAVDYFQLPQIHGLPGSGKDLVTSGIVSFYAAYRGERNSQGMMMRSGVWSSWNQSIVFCLKQCLYFKVTFAYMNVTFAQVKKLHTFKERADPSTFTLCILDVLEVFEATHLKHLMYF